MTSSKHPRYVIIKRFIYVFILFKQHLNRDITFSMTSLKRALQKQNLTIQTYSKLTDKSKTHRRKYIQSLYNYLNLFKKPLSLSFKSFRAFQRSYCFGQTIKSAPTIISKTALIFSAFGQRCKTHALHTKSSEDISQCCGPTFCPNIPVLGAPAEISLQCKVLNAVWP